MANLWMLFDEDGLFISSLLGVDWKYLMVQVKYL
jgi:hypothetical protein